MADVLNRTTKQYLKSVNTPNFPTADWIINPDLTAVAGVPSKYWKITGDVVAEMSSAEKDTAELDNIKSAKNVAIDGKTTSLIDIGFTYAAKQFSLSLPSQIKLIGAHELKDDAALTYPITWNTIDDFDKHDIDNATALDNFYKTALGTIRAHLDSGTALKNQIRAATTIAEVDAVVDNR